MTLLDVPINVRIETAGDLMRALGDVPATRIRLQPAFMNATEQHLLRLLEHDKSLCELIDGVLVEKAVGWEESFLTQILSRILVAHVSERNLGAITGPDGPYRLRAGLVRLPDLAFVPWEVLNRAGREAIPSIVPELGIEVLSPPNTPAEMKRKREEYFTAGMRLLWIIDPESRTVAVYTSAQHPDRVSGSNEILDGGDVLPDFALPLAKLFAELDRLPPRPPPHSAGQHE